MSITVRIPAPLRKYTNGLAKVTATGRTVLDVIDSLETQYPGLKPRLCDDQGQLRRTMNICLGDENIRFLDGLATPLGEHQELSILLAIAGG